MKYYDLLLMAGIVVGCFTLGLAFGSMRENSIWVGHAIEHGCAHYDSQAGDFTWNDEEKK